ncbi:glycosyl transferase family 90 [Vibrio sp. 10N.261.55.A7]|uniref:glycosyl transferase family 90 n=1 Tax=Vibrio sp. 10N.261.55.A7 TaxID=1880851 RepID=UPI000C84FF87|nr:glycosyl transferase family 90 [Vibrio sp. 10N.261.55.A7]PMK05049.1 lipopolysaccharide A protein [Vibrio sp. 10N.261.55.A7]
MKLFYYLKHTALELLPRTLFRRHYSVLNGAYQERESYIKGRVKYYLKVKGSFYLSNNSVEIDNYKRKGYTSYYFDLREFLHYFPKHFRFNYYFGDETHIESVPTLFKARPVEGDNGNSVLFKLDKRRHFRFVNDKLKYSDKKDMAVFRGAVTQPHRIRFMQKMFEHPLMDAGQSNSSNDPPEWQKPFMSVDEQLQYKFLICLEGNDVASNLKWAMSSNSVVITPKMKYETWFMEGTLKAGVHYIEVKDDWSDFDEKMQYYLAHPEEAEKIINNAHDYVAPFKDEKLEQLICIRTLERYFELSGQYVNEHQNDNS